MARARFIRPEFFSDAKIGDLSLGARLLYIGTWIIADINGTLEWNAAELKHILFGYDDFLRSDVDGMMKELVTCGLVSTYEHGMKVYAHIINFHKHQSFTKSEQERGARNPLPPGLKSSIRNMPGHSRASCSATDSATVGSTLVLPLDDTPSPAPAPAPGDMPSSTRVLPPPASPSAETPGSGSRGPSSLRDEYQFFKNTAEYRNLKSAHCRVTNDTFLEWKSLIDDYGLNVVIEYAEKIPRADDRYPSRVQSMLTGADEDPTSGVPHLYPTPEWGAWITGGKNGPEPQMFA